MKTYYRPHLAQEKIHKALRPYLSDLEIMVISGRRFGKTVLAVNEIVARANDIPGARIWYVAPTKDQAYRIAWRKMTRPRRENEIMMPPYLPPELIKKKREDKHYIELINESLIEFLGTQDEIFLLGTGLHFVVFDEFPTIPWTVWIDTVKPMLVDYNGDALFIGSIPDPKIHNITPEFVDMYEDFLYGSPKRKKKAFNFTSFLNPYISHKKIKEDIKELERKGRGADAERIYYGKYTREHGIVFPKFSYEKHTCLPFKIPGNWTRLMAVDPHPQKPINALWCAIDPQNHYWFYRETEFTDISGRSLTLNEVAYEIRQVLENEEKEKIAARFIDPTFAKIDQNIFGAKSVKGMFGDFGLFFREADREFITFFNRLTDMLVEEPEPSIHIFRTCTGFIRQMQHYFWEAWASLRAREQKGVRNKPKKVDDDYIDCAKYIINSGVRNISMISNDLVKFKSSQREKWAERRFL